MLGQGRPNRSPEDIHRRIWLAGGWAFRLALGLVLAVALRSSAEAASTIRLRIAWGGGAARIWQGEISAPGAVVSDPRPLGIEADEPGSMWMEDGRLMVRQRSLRTYDGVDLLVEGALNGMLAVRLEPADSPGAKPIEIPLELLLRDQHNSSLDEKGNRLLVRRAPDDVLRVQIKQTHLVFAPGATFQFDVQPHLLPVAAGTRVRVRVELRRARSSETLWSHERDLTTGETASWPEEIVLPKEEGVYDVAITAAHTGMLRLPPPKISPLDWVKQSIAERKVQLLVLAEEPASSDAVTDEALKQVVEINPVNPSWWERFAALPQWRIGPRLARGPLGSGHRGTRTHALGELVELAPGRGEPSWEAYTLPIDSPGRPHILEIDYPSDVPQTMGISVVEPNDAGAVYPMGLDSGFEVAADVTGLKPPPCWLRHRILFWPRTRSPMVLVTNRRDDAPALFGKIRVLAVEGAVPRAYSPRIESGRLLAGYLDKPLFPENFSASEAIGGASDLGVDDWLTFYQGGTRLVEYLNHVGYNGLMLSVMADGSTIYPSAVLEPTPRYDTGAFLDSGQDPVRKDVLEMLLRLFDREQMSLIPALDFSAPLPELEAIARRGGSEAEGLRWVNAQGQTWTDVYAAERGAAAYYNVFHPRVQQAMLGAVRELITRYGEHPSFAGLALQLSGYGYAQLPGPDWGLDDATVGKFQRDIKLAIPGTGPGRFAERAQFLMSRCPRDWLQWRAVELAKFYRCVEAEVKAVRPDARLYLAGANMFGGEEWERQLRPTLPQRLTSITEALLRVGIDARQFEAEGPVVLRTEQVVPRWSLARQAVNLEIQQMPDMDAYFQGTPVASSLFFHPPQELRLASFDEKRPFKNSYMWLATQAVPADHQNRRRFVHALATIDSQAIFDGGWQLPLGQEDSLRDIAAAFRRLPAVRFQRLDEQPGTVSTQPVTVRHATVGGETYVYFANDAPFPAQLTVQLDLPAGAAFEELSGRRTLGPVAEVGDGRFLSVDLEPHDLVAVRFDTPGVRLLRARVAWSPEVRQALERRISDLLDRAAVLRDASPSQTLANAGFDQPASGDALPGWLSSAPEGTRIELDGKQKHDGISALRMASTGPAVTLVSEPFDPPTTGRLTVSLWLRTSDAARQPAVRVALVGRYNGRDLLSSVYVGQGWGGHVPARVLNNEWEWLPIEVKDLPLYGLSKLQLRFDLLGPGEVWIDDVGLRPLEFSERERAQLLMLLTPAKTKLERGHVGDCLGLLEGYWPRFLAANVPLPPAAVSRAVEPPRRTAPPTPPQPERSAGFLDRMKGWLPAWR